ncbi:3-deoxy-7-phosphoheptulonate synthase class II [Pseudoglutamicibacter albus]|uniref:Phospho-2-dehydro-3-deoxyheptonate aldolase n=1 Tax=Pseudoglutamicibacter cumminsii TaxID=156979 RepID=A0AAP4CCY8_9MICC|nr:MULTISPECIES: 3-deoxy-7-phosphoheptulonate synthase class II [Pseudoglutamicibacter]MCT1686346.1 3-deoxy-7-phosphoheptulonate synthase class II [Pseudoglutamicibacter cumminsii]MDK6275811.1 3-deoxy-7-phosphoheptulonate synthase class II [Pseudoglutamicibacter cumminsii]MDK7083628.1 3-deoxy-7-phosphoheptulonate synthase class II [Pseudoglutamicibacter cumminsii]PKY80470.1 3-deoxy-7-phosphoheptulonate synthase class II [Pseudoglutamicibacter albus]WIK84619.1 3-deoxy-7-phosphoheptulonate synth
MLNNAVFSDAGSQTGPATDPALDRWRSLPIKQQPDWSGTEAHDRAVAELGTKPPLVFAGEVDALREQLARATRGEMFVLQGGDCAETFAGATADKIQARVKTILQMAVVLTYGAQMPVLKMGRMAGQFAKPRSSATETRDGVTLPTFRGEIVNGFEFTEEARMPDPMRMVQAYDTSAATLNLIRAFTQGGFADLRSVHSWNRGFMTNPAYQEYEELAAEIDRAVRFMDACGADFEALRRTDFYAAHEALLLDYERALTRTDSRTGNPYATSAHFLWIGERTRDIDGAHVDFLSHVENPLGVKLGPTSTGEDALRLIEKLNPNRIPGRLTFITRMGASNIREKLPPIVEAVKSAGEDVLWITDPMHGNTVTSSNGYKTRRVEDVMDEVKGFFEVHQSLGTVPGGLHIEMTGDDVAECLGGADPIREDQFDDLYETVCDPRLNHSQSLELAFQVANGLAHR